MLIGNKRAGELYGLVTAEARGLTKNGSESLTRQVLGLIGVGVFPRFFYLLHPGFKEVQSKIESRTNTTEFNKDDLHLILSILARVFDKKIIGIKTYKESLLLLIDVLKSLGFDDYQLLSEELATRIRPVREFREQA